MVVWRLYTSTTLSQDFPSVWIKDVHVLVTLGRIEQRQAGSMYNDGKKICLNYNIKRKSLTFCTRDCRPEGLSTKLKPVKAEMEIIGVKLKRSHIAVIIDDDTRLYRRYRGAGAGSKTSDEGGEKEVKMKNILLMAPKWSVSEGTVIWNDEEGVPY